MDQCLTDDAEIIALMGAWAEGVFDNDAAGDWADELVRSSDYALIGRALATVAQSPGIDECCEALVAAEVVAAGRGWPLRGLYEPLKDWLAQSDYRPTDEEQQLALAAIAIVRDRSDLAEEFGSENKQWLTSLQKLNDRLSHPPKPRDVKVKPKRVVPPDEAAAIQRLDAPSSTIEFTKGGRVKSLHLCDHTEETLSACLPHVNSAKRIHITHSFSSSNESIPLGDAAFASLDQFEQLEDLTLCRTRITDATLARIGRLARLKRLLLTRTPISDAGVARLAGLVNLEELHLGDPTSGNRQITSAGLVCLRGMTKLRRLELWGTAADDSIMPWLTQMQNLNSLDLRGTKVTGAGLFYLANLTNLEFLELKGLPVDNEHVAQLAGLKNLKRLTVSGRRITDGALDTIVELTSLAGLGLENTSITDAGLQKIALLPKLEVVWLKGTDVTTEGARWLRQARPGLDVQGRNR